MKHRILLAGVAAATALGATGIAFGQRVFVFTDVPEASWARDYVEWAAANHIMNGPDGQDRLFQPNKPTTRAELAATLYRLDQKHSVEIDVLRERILALELAVHGPDWEGGDGMSSRSYSSYSFSRMSRTSSSARSMWSAGSRASIPAGAQSGKVLFTASLVGSSEVPPVDSNGRGNVKMWWTDQGLWYDAYVTGLSGPITGAHFHLGGPTQTGEVILAVDFDENNRARGFWPDLPSETWQELTNGNVYFNVHTEKNPDGEIRGQVLFRR